MLIPHSHPMHLHMHQSQLMYRGNQPWNNETSNFPDVPMKRDTIEIPPRGSLVLRFKADNPGIALCKSTWNLYDPFLMILVHCHLELHVEAGKTVTFIEAPDALQNPC